MVLVGVSLPYPTSFKNQFSHYFFISKPTSKSYQSSSGMCVFCQKCIFFTKNSKICWFFFSDEIVLYLVCIWILKTDLKSGLSIMRYIFSNFFCKGFIWKQHLANFEKYNLSIIYSKNSYHVIKITA